MAFPLLQIMIGIGVGVLGFLLLRPRQLTYDSHQKMNQKNNKSRSSTDLTNNYQTPVGDTCVICLEEMTVENIKELKCGHALHETCYVKCLKYGHLKCPNCRKKMG